jgi:hypothetical protein
VSNKSTFGEDIPFHHPKNTRRSWHIPCVKRIRMAWVLPTALSKLKQLILKTILNYLLLVLIAVADFM